MSLQIMISALKEISWGQRDEVEMGRILGEGGEERLLQRVSI